MTNKAQKIWTEYYARIRRRRIAEAEIVHGQMRRDGVIATTFLAIDFLHFGPVESKVRQLAEQLTEDYSMTVTKREDGDFWTAKGTTRPDSLDGIDAQTCADWVEFMCDVAHSYGCVFSTWRLTDLERDISWTNETVDVDPDIKSG